jgi:hypothetical protein
MEETKQKKKSKKTGEASFLSGQDTERATLTIREHFRNELGLYTTGNPGTQKRYTNKEDLQEAIIKYFEYCDQNKKTLTMTGLAIALGFRSRQALVNYEKEVGYEFAHDIILFAKMKIEEATEQRLHDRNSNIIGAIFSLKNNWNWLDKSEVKMDQRTLTFNGFEIEGLNDEKTIDVN